MQYGIAYGGETDHCGTGRRFHHQAGLSGRIERCDNVKDVGLYIEKIDEMIERKKKLLSEPLEGSMRKLL